ncbi:TetR/AcrR family transcriptional regulator [Extibacter muris]|uniref:TetR/AcrR family transcriptional regulator n=1 Tax=Extibacter muris TaxID=1796622 RepID=UPI001D071278|nr:TetR/AcrR family transcriptional regulator [Extibacter muris]MCB6203123.1 TetR/AcrR family transcriptional regulator [Extibacter muris]MCQ4664348.1 TetR/AcrR family transcriptional regulator [Extibacter muris]MCQ4692314.1 TetR/AcrR family transcriptional regulator [Extibacter muris]MCQ4692441.1 TetR/AcrR family transcriptional regulator [Extibacter muris]
MNDKFYKLPEEKQRRITNAAYKVFSRNPYKKAPMSEIAAEGEISKSLLFHYFVNKKELYVYLWANAIEMTRKAIAEYKTLETEDFFEMLKKSMLAKCSLMREYPYIYAFLLKAYYETAADVKEIIRESYAEAEAASQHKAFDKMDISALRKDIDPGMMYTEIFYAVDGYMLKKYRSDRIVPDEIERDIMMLIDFWSKIYSQKEDEHE